MGKRIMRSFRINEISLVDNPAQEGARVAIMKRADPKAAPAPRIDTLKRTDGDWILKGYGDLADVLTSEQDGHQHGISVSRWERHNGSVKIEYHVTYAIGPEDESGHDHPIARTDASYALGTVAGHTHTVDSETLATAAMNLVMKTQPKPTQKGDPQVDQKEAEKLQKKVERQDKILALKSDQRTHFDKLDETAQDAFLEKSDDERQSEVDEAAQKKLDTDPVVYTTMDGIDLRKSVGELAITQAKALDAVRKENVTLKAEREQAALEKRAETELPHLPGTVQARAAMIKAVESIEDETQREQAKAALKANNEAMAKAFKTVGVAGGEPDLTPNGEISKLAKQYAEKHNVSIPDATVAVLDTPEGKAAYAKQRKEG